MLMPPFAERPHRHAFEVNDIDIVGGNQHLPQVLIPVDARADHVGILLFGRGKAERQAARGNYRLRHLLAETMRIGSGV